MKILYANGNFPKTPSGKKIVTIGVFDGVHRGHKRVLSSVVHEARKRGLLSAVVTFTSHPSHYFNPLKKIPALTSLDHKLKFIGEQGIDVCYVLEFNKRLAQMHPEDFVKKILIDRIGMTSLYVGEDFVFGKNVVGNIHSLKKLSSVFDFSLHVLKHVKLRRRIVSSTLIRSLIGSGDLRLAEIFLGRKVSFLGEVVRGEGRGKILGFPTANIRPHHEVLAPYGIYLSFASIGEKKYRSLTYIGSKPTFHDNSSLRSIEVFLFGTHPELYGKIIEVHLIKKIRDDLKFPSEEKLVAQMKIDVSKARQFFKNLP